MDDNQPVEGEQQSSSDDSLDERKKVAAAQIWKSYLNWKSVRDDRENYKRLGSFFALLVNFD